MADSEELIQQLHEMQTQLAYQEDTVQALHEALAVQQQEITLLKRQLQLLKQRQDEQGIESQAHAGSAGEEKPPHY